MVRAWASTKKECYKHTMFSLWSSSTKGKHSIGLHCTGPSLLMCRALQESFRLVLNSPQEMVDTPSLLISDLMVFRALQESLLYILYHNREMADSHGAILLHVFIFLKAYIASKSRTSHFQYASSASSHCVWIKIAEMGDIKSLICTANQDLKRYRRECIQKNNY